MQRCGIDRLKKIGIFSLFSFMNMTVAMVILNESPLKSDKIMTIFDPKKELELDNLWNDLVPGSILITPDGESVLIGERGRVRRAYINKEEDDVFPETIIKHRWVQHSPMIKVAQKNDKSLLVVSAGNYTNEDNKHVAEYIIFCNELPQFKKFNWPIQTISLNSYGKLLAIARSDSVTVMDLETGKNDEVLLRGCFVDRNNWIIDIAMNACGDSIIAATSLGDIQLMKLYEKDNGDFYLSILAHVTNNEIPEKIYYPNVQELLYINREGKAKIIAMAEVVDSQDLVPIVFADSSLCDKAIADSSDCVATAHWNNDKKVKKNNKHIIEISRRSVGCVEKFTLAVPIQEQYAYITDLGQRSFGKGHLLQVALRGRRVAALTTEGKLYFWSLPEKHRICNEIEKRDQEEINFRAREKDEVQITRGRRSQSASSPEKRQSLGETDAGDKLTKKPSPRPIQVLQALSRPFSSRENSSASSSRDNSPSQSPHRTDNKNEVTFASEVKVFKKSNEDVKIFRKSDEDVKVVRKSNEDVKTLKKSSEDK